MYTGQEVKAILMNWAPRLLFFILVLYFGFFLIRRSLVFFERRLRAKKVDATSLGFFISILSYFLKVLVVVVGLGILNVPMASLTAVVGASTLSIGLALQGSLSNLAGGLVLVTTQPFKVGDYIVSDGFEGTVEEISVLTTGLQTFDGKKVIIPNSIVSSKGIVNYSLGALRRIDIPLLISYKAPIDKVKRTLEGVGQEIQGAQRVEAVLSKYEDSGYLFTLRLWIENGEYFKQLFILNEKIKPALDKEGIELAYPHLEVILPGGLDEKIQQ
ncbi:MAG: mechanosensitive ion channel family protein [Tissierellia bacterium]|nr:mechanosensitive ion channel family protein [Tissierellia bacterium]